MSKTKPAIAIVHDDESVCRCLLPARHFSRERRKDIGSLAEIFLQKASQWPGALLKTARVVIPS